MGKGGGDICVRLAACYWEWASRCHVSWLSLYATSCHPSLTRAPAAECGPRAASLSRRLTSATWRLLSVAWC